MSTVHEKHSVIQARAVGVQVHGALLRALNILCSFMGLRLAYDVILEKDTNTQHKHISAGDVMFL